MYGVGSSKMFSSVDFVVLLHSQRYSCLCCKLFENIRVPWIFARVFFSSFFFLFRMRNTFELWSPTTLLTFSQYEILFFDSLAHTRWWSFFFFALYFVILDRDFEEKKELKTRFKSLWINSIVLLCRTGYSTERFDCLLFGCICRWFLWHYFLIIINWAFRENRISRYFAFWLRTLSALIQLSYCFECPQIPVQI